MGGMAGFGKHFTATTPSAVGRWNGVESSAHRVSAAWRFRAKLAAFAR
jgi:hypothetical protein